MVFVSSGNAGGDFEAPFGVPDDGTIASPATAKNAIAVISPSSRVQNGVSRVTVRVFHADASTGKAMDVNLADDVRGMTIVDKDKAFEALGQGVDAGDRDAAWWRQDSDLDSLRDDPRFEELIARMNIDE